LQAQVRIYTINRGEMDDFVKHFKEQTKPIHDQIGWPVVSTWINKPQNEFIWIRTHTDAADLEAKTKAFREAVAAAGITLGANVAKMEVREVEMA
jgi:NIPSNAP